jgi:hypothetical protein
MADGFIQVYPDSTGKQIDTSQLTVGANTVQRQRMVIAADGTAASLAGVPAGGARGGGAPPPPPRRPPGRTLFSASSAAAVAGTVAEGLMTLTPMRDGANGTAGTSFQPTTGKALRITGLVMSVRASAAVASWARFTLRMTATGAVAAASPVITAIEVGTPAQVIGATATIPFDVPDGLELTGNMQFGVSQIAAATTVLETVTVVGFEY